MDSLQSMKVFVRVAQANGFAKAARQLRLSPAAVTKHVAALESHVGARLFDRTTRRVSLTEAGRIYLERSFECLQALEDADASVSELASSPTGTLCITAPFDLANQVGEVCAAFLKAHPRMKLDLRLSNSALDLVDQGIDVALRVAPSLDGQFVARPIAPVQAVLCAAPSYLREHGRPRRPEELRDHPILGFAVPRPRDELPFERNGKRLRVKIDNVLTSNSGMVLRTALLAGAGIGELPDFLAAADLDAHRLVALFPEWTYLGHFKLFALYPHRRFVPAKVRLFIDLLRREWETINDSEGSR